MNIKAWYWMGRYAPIVAAFLGYPGAAKTCAFFLGHGDRAWKKMGGKFRYQGIPVEDRVRDELRRDKLFLKYRDADYRKIIILP